MRCGATLNCGSYVNTARSSNGITAASRDTTTGVERRRCLSQELSPISDSSSSLRPSTARESDRHDEPPGGLEEKSIPTSFANWRRSSPRKCFCIAWWRSALGMSLMRSDDEFFGVNAATLFRRHAGQRSEVAVNGISEPLSRARTRAAILPSDDVLNESWSCFMCTRVYTTEEILLSRRMERCRRFVGKTRPAASTGP